MPNKSKLLYGFTLVAHLVDSRDTLMATLEVKADLSDVVPKVPVAVRDEIGRVGVLTNTAPITYKWIGNITSAKAVKNFAPTGSTVTLAVAKEKMGEWAGGKMPAKEIMRDFRAGKLHSGKNGPIVRNKKQARAIEISYARKEGAKIPKKKANKRRGH